MQNINAGKYDYYDNVWPVNALRTILMVNSLVSQVVT